MTHEEELREEIKFLRAKLVVIYQEYDKLKAELDRLTNQVLSEHKAKEGIKKMKCPDCGSLHGPSKIPGYCGYRT